MCMNRNRCIWFILCWFMFYCNILHLYFAKRFLNMTRKCHFLAQKSCWRRRSGARPWWCLSVWTVWARRRRPTSSAASGKLASRIIISRCVCVCVCVCECECVCVCLWMVRYEKLGLIPKKYDFHFIFITPIGMYKVLKVISAKKSWTAGPRGPRFSWKKEQKG